MRTWIQNNELASVVIGLLGIGAIYLLVTGKKSSASTGSPAAGGASSPSGTNTTQSFGGEGYNSNFAGANMNPNVGTVNATINSTLPYQTFKTCLGSIKDAAGFNSCVSNLYNSVSVSDKNTYATQFDTLNKVGAIGTQGAAITTQYASAILAADTFGKLRAAGIDYYTKLGNIVSQSNVPSAQSFLASINTAKSRLQSRNLDVYNSLPVSKQGRKGVVDQVHAICWKLWGCIGAATAAEVGVGMGTSGIGFVLSIGTYIGALDACATKFGAPVVDLTVQIVFGS